MSDVTASSDKVAGKIVQLPCGLGPDSEGKVHREAEIVAMTGLVRKNIARPDVRQSPSKVIDVILLACLRRVGPVTKMDRRTLDKLLAGDRDFLVLEIRKFSMGNKITSVVRCGACNEKVDITYNLDSVPVTRIPDSGGDIEVVSGERIFTVSYTPEGVGEPVTVRFRFPSGGDQSEASSLGNKNPIEANYRMYYRCLVDWNGKRPSELSPTLFEDQPLPVLDAIDKEFMRRLPGPQFGETVPCALCGADNTIDLSASDFFFPLAKGRRQIG